MFTITLYDYVPLVPIYAIGPRRRQGKDGAAGREGRKRAHRKRKRHHWEAAAVKRRMCEALENGTRRLVAWPETADDTDVWLRPEEAMRATTVRRMEETYGK